MKRLKIVIVLLLLPLIGIAQSNWRSKNARVNILFSPQFEMSKVAGSYSPLLSLTGMISFGDHFAIGGYANKKLSKIWNSYEIATDQFLDLDANYQTAGLSFRYALNFGLMRTRGGHYATPKLQILLGVRAGGGSIRLESDYGWETTIDYFYHLQFSAGVMYPLNDFLFLTASGSYSRALSIDKLVPYLGNNDLSGPGASVGVIVKLLR